MSAQIEATGAVSVQVEAERSSSFLFGRVFLTRTGIHFARNRSGVAVASVAHTRFGKWADAFAALAIAGVILGGCAAPTVPLAGADPADPGAKVAGVGYRSTVAPYSGLRPTTLSGWKEQNQRVTPSPKSGHEH